MWRITQTGRLLASAFLFVMAAAATSVPRLTFEQLTDTSDAVVSGTVTRSWSDWDSEHKFIWTHHEITVSSAHKGAAVQTLVISEPGGVVGNRGLNIAGAVTYRAGDNVLVFAQRMLNGYMRTTGWGQGKYLVDSTGRVHADSSLAGIERIDLGASAGTSLISLEGMHVTELRQRIAARLRNVQVQTQGSTK
jgi:hypothetical protein